jgi:hypothetical protein
MEKLETVLRYLDLILEMDSKRTPGTWRAVDSETGDEECDETCMAVETSSGMLDGDNLIADAQFIAGSSGWTRPLVEATKYAMTHMPKDSHFVSQLLKLFPDDLDQQIQLVQQS